MQEELGAERLTVAEAAARVGVAESSIRRWTMAGRMRPVAETERGAPLFDAAEVERVAAAEASARAASRPGGVPTLGALAARGRPWGEPFEPGFGPAPVSIARGIDEPAIAARLAALLERGELGASVFLAHVRSGEIIAAERPAEVSDRATVAARLARALASDAEARGGRQAYRAMVEGEGPALTIAVRGPDLDDAGEGRSPGVMAAHTERLAALVIAQAEKARDFELSARRDDRATFEQFRVADRVHVETVVAGLKEANRALADELREARERIRGLEAAAAEIAKIREAALNDGAEREQFRLSAAAERERETEAAKGRQQMYNKSGEAFLGLLPQVAKPLLRNLGVDVGGSVAEDAVSGAAASLFSKLDADDRAQLAAFLRMKKGHVAGQEFDAMCSAFAPNAGQPPGAPSPPAPVVPPPPPPAPAGPMTADQMGERIDVLLREVEAATAAQEGAERAGNVSVVVQMRARIRDAKNELEALGPRMEALA